MSLLRIFSATQRLLEERKLLTGSRLVGYVISADFDAFTVSTCTALQNTAGPLSRGGFALAMAESSPDTAILLRVQGTARSPLSGMEDMTNYEMGKRGLPELDRMTSTEMSWSCLRCDVLGCFYEKDTRICFGGDLRSLAAANEYRIYTPGELLPLLINGVYDTAEDGSGVYRAVEYTPAPDFVPAGALRPIGCYRPTETLSAPSAPACNLYLDDVVGHRIALFGKTRSGKSNTLKVIAAAMLEYNMSTPRLGQLIIDTNGEYAHDNPQDGRCLRSRYPSACVVYSVNAVPGGPDKLLRFNFYQTPVAAMSIFKGRIAENGSTYVNAFLAADLLSIDEITHLAPGSDRVRAVRRLQFFWAILHLAGFPADENALEKLHTKLPKCKSVFDPCFSRAIRQKLYPGGAPPVIDSLDALAQELRKLLDAYTADPNHPVFCTASGTELLSPDDLALLRFAFPAAGRSGPSILSVCRFLHDANASDFLTEIPGYLDASKMVIVDVANASPELVRFLTDQICVAVFRSQEKRFTANTLGDHYVQLYIEEAHNYFPASDKDVTDIYSRIAKEGAKYHIGITYSTQSPSTISGELLSQTENFIVAHLDSSYEADALARRSAPFDGVKTTLLRTRTPGYVHLMTASQRYPIPVQITSFAEIKGGVA